VPTLPLLGSDGLPFPARDLAITLAAGVIVTSLGLASLALPALLRHWVQAPEADPGAAEQRARRTAGEAALKDVERLAAVLAADPSRRPAAVAAARARVTALYQAQWQASSPGAPDARDEGLDRELHRSALRAERAAMQQAGPAEGLDDGRLHRILREFDLLEASLARADNRGRHPPGDPA